MAEAPAVIPPKVSPAEAPASSAPKVAPAEKVKASPAKKESQKKSFVIESSSEDVPILKKSPGKPAAKKPSTPKKTSRKELEEDDDVVVIDDEPALKKMRPASSPKKAASPKKSAPKKVVEEEEQEKKPAKTASPKKAPETSGKRERETAKVNEEKEDTPKKKGKPGGAAWRSFKDRAPPPMLGMKDLPQGKPYCLYGKVFVITGILESLDRDTAASLIEEYGGDVAKSVAKKVTHALVGNEPGPSKVKEIEERKLPMLTEDELFEMIRTLPEQKPPKDFLKKREKAAKAKVEGKEQPKEVLEAIRSVKPSGGGGVPLPSAVIAAAPPTSTPVARATPATPVVAPLGMSGSTQEQSRSQGTSTPGASQPLTFQADLWTTKYAPKDSKLLLSNPGPIKKVQEWLARWPKAHNDKGFKKALLISGVPGIGKTTTANLLAREAGYNVIEFNASDTRSKKKMQEEGFTEIGGNRSMNEFFGAKSQANTAAAAALKKKTLVIMDEVDGMGGSDRGGNQELIALIKKTRIPIICICNDRQKATVKTLANYCEDIRFQRPQADHIASRVRAIMENEGFKYIDMNALRSLCASVNNDIRQVLNLLQMLRLTTDRLEGSPEAFQSAMAEGRHVELNSFAIIPQLFSGGARTPSQALDLFFHDYDLIPLFIQENYLSAIPNVPKHVVIENMAQAADCISYGDIVKDTLMQGQEWGLLPFLGMVSTVIPCALLRGRAGKVDFPEWLGKNSTASKEKRLLKEIQIHMSAKTAGAGKAEILLDYIPSLAVPLLRPLQERGKDGIDEVLQVMEEYGLTKDDWETIFVLNGMEESIQKLDSQLKSAFTKKYNKTQKKFAVAPVGKKGGAKREVDEDIGFMNEEAAEVVEGSASEEESEKIEKDALIKKKAKKAAPAASKAKATATKKKK